MDIAIERCEMIGRNVYEQMQIAEEAKVQSGDKQGLRLREKKAGDVMSDKRRLVEMPYTASLRDTMNALLANRVVGVPVAAPPGHWIGAGGSMILESDKQTGTVRKHYIGMVTMLDILSHIAGDGSDFDQKILVPVSSIIGHCLESLSLWTLNPNTSILDAMEVFSKGIHRVMVPIDSQMENTTGVELVEAAWGYRMLTQMDLLRFLKAHESELKEVMSRPVGQLGAFSEVIFAVTDQSSVIEAIKCMKTGSLIAVPIVETSTDFGEERGQLINGKDRKVVGTFSATDLRECQISQLRSGLSLSVLQFTESCSKTRARELVTCHPESSLAEVIDKAVNKHVHRVWLVDHQNLLMGLLSLTDIMRMVRVSMLSLSS